MKSPPGEFELIARLCAGLGHGRRTLIGPGDDCALLARSRGEQLVTIDSMVERVHFKLEWTTPEALGARALTVNLSDIAAMGGRPAFCVVNLAIRPNLDTRFFERLYDGLGAAAKATGTEVVGGNITRADALAITIALWGDAGTAVLRRDSAQPGDDIYVTGTVGDAAAGLRILNRQLRARGAARAFLIERFLNPNARLDAGQRLARIRPAAAAIDISDGLWQDLGHILERSGVGASIDANAIPLSSAYRAVLGDDLGLALGGGEDYELLFCLRGTKEAALTRRLGVPVRRIGVITRDNRAMLAGYDGKFPRGFDQLRAGR
ncbi:MAG: thiamine-phosphate kinase [Candidatus Binataceae bacterium]